MIDMEKVKVLLVYPNTRWHEKRCWLTIPYAALLLSAILKDRFCFDILDANGGNLSEEECKLQLKKRAADIILVSALSVEYYMQYHTLFDLVKEACPNSTLVVGGVYPTVLGEEVLKDKNVDYIFVGHAEERIIDFLEKVINKKEELFSLAGVGYKDKNDNIKINGVNTYISDIKNIIKPDYSVLDIKPYLEWKQHDHQIASHRKSSQIITSYGCPYNCLFCATRTISGHKVSIRPVDDILDEIDFLIKEHGVNALSFQDDLFLADRKRTEKLLEAFIERDYNLEWNSSASAWDLDGGFLELMKKSGCRLITMSVESGCQRVLKEVIHKPVILSKIAPIVKKCKDIGIDIVGNFVIGFPGEKWDEIRETFRFAEKCDFDLAHFHVATPLPKTELYEIAKKEKLLPDDFSFLDERYFGFGRAFIKTDEFTPEQLMILRAYEWDRINFSSRKKIEKAAELYHLTLEELGEHRRQTIAKTGVHLA